ncbi:MAG: efflux RND transporter periplasmic adaptor subunit [Odoribacteraceae bacterium]|jgi:cobalt-zinc-cadmium efflux system membrane fusion protein|nr:efflux RND transporter periplasmic adaptor subunit [Odoribacteraceae bacterium]
MKHVIFFSIALLSLLCAACGGRESVENTVAEAHEHEEIALTTAQMKAVDIRLGQVEERDLRDVIRVNGQLALDPQKRAEVTSLVGGIVRQVLVTEGTYVTAGQPVAYLENTAIVELQKEFLVLREEAAVADLELARQRELAANGAGIERSMQQASATFRVANARLAGVEKQLRQLAIDPARVSGDNLLTRVPLNAPITGYINRIRVSTGSYVDTQTSLMNITDNRGIHCDVKIFEKDIRHVAAGQEVDITLTSQPGERLKGRVYEVNNSFEEETRAIIVHVILRESGNAKLLQGMYVTGLINTGVQKTGAVPNDAIVSKDGKKFIFALEDEANHGEGDDEHDDADHRLHFRRVEIIAGVSESGYTQVTPVDPLPEGATIVVSNAFYISSMSADHGEHDH